MSTKFFLGGSLVLAELLTSISFSSELTTARCCGLVAMGVIGALPWIRFCADRVYENLTGDRPTNV